MSEQRERARFFLSAAEALEIYAKKPLQKNSCKDMLARFLESKPEEPREWQDAAMLGDRILYLTAGELAELGRKVREMLDVYFERLVKPELRPPGARPVSYLTIAFPNDAGRRTGRG